MWYFFLNKMDYKFFGGETLMSSTTALNTDTYLPKHSSTKSGFGFI